MAWGSRDIMRATLLVFGVYIALRLLWLANHLFFAVFLGILFGLALERGVDILARWRVPRGLGAAAIAIAFLGALVGTGALIAPTVREQGMELRNRLPDAVEKVQEWVERHVHEPQRPSGKRVLPDPAEPRRRAGNADRALSATRSRLRSRDSRRCSGSCTRRRCTPWRICPSRPSSASCSRRSARSDRRRRGRRPDRLPCTRSPRAGA
jgi:hypothetical protein